MPKEVEWSSDLKVILEHHRLLRKRDDQVDRTVVLELEVLVVQLLAGQKLGDHWYLE